MDRQTHGQIDIWTDRHINKQAHEQSNTWTNRHMGRQTHGQIDTQTNRHIYEQTQLRRLDPGATQTRAKLLLEKNKAELNLAKLDCEQGKISRYRQLLKGRGWEAVETFVLLYILSPRFVKTVLNMHILFWYIFPLQKRRANLLIRDEILVRM